MRHFRSLAVAALVYGGCLGMTAVSPSRADAQIVYGSYSVSPYGTYSNYQQVPLPGLWYYNPPVIYPQNWNNWGGNPHWSGYPQWYVNYVRWNSPANRYTNPYIYRGWRRW